MLKFALKLIKKTKEWLHRTKGGETVNLPRINGTLRRFRLFGNTKILDTGEMLGVGDYDSESGKYVVSLKAHGKNICGGEEYYQAWKDSHAFSMMTLGSTGFTVYYSPNYNGTVVFDKRHIRFKENTQYTIAGQFTSVDLKMRFIYSDGTYSNVVLENYTRKRNIHTGSVCSQKDKTLVAIDAYVEATGSYVSYIKFLGIYEGAYNSYQECYELYNGEKFTYTLDAPLLSMGYASDELDLITGEVTRKIRTESIGADASVECEYAEGTGIFIITPEVPMRSDSSLLSSLPVVDETEILTVDTGVSLCDGGRIAVKLPAVTNESEFLSYLSENPFTITYVMKDTVTETAEGTLPNRDDLSITDVYCEVAPKKFYAEYV